VQVIIKYDVSETEQAEAVEKALDVLGVSEVDVLHDDGKPTGLKIYSREARYARQFANAAKKGPS